MLDCVFCVNDLSGSYYRYAYVAILSVFRNSGSRIRVHLITDSTLSEEAHVHLRALADAHGNAISFHYADSLCTGLFEQMAGRFSVATFFRFFIHQLVDADIVLYLDADVIVQLDVAEIFAHGLQGRPVAAVRDPYPWFTDKADARQRFARMGVAAEAYFNAGVMLMDLRTIRELPGEGNPFLRQMFLQHEQGLPLQFPDQDVLNAIFCPMNGVTYLDGKYNELVSEGGHYFNSPDLCRGRIMHYTTAKPWSSFYPAGLAFWKYYAASPWGGEVFARLARLPATRAYEHYKFALAHGLLETRRP